MTLKIAGIEQLRQYENHHLGHSGWFTVTQELINKFAETTGDNQWIHVDLEAAKAGPFGTTIAHGYLVLSLIPRLLPEILVIENAGIAVNYGANKIRFTSPVPSNARIRLGAKLARLEEFTGGTQIYIEGTVETENIVKPSLVAELIYRYYG